jgi:hypothetical protein
MTRSTSEPNAASAPIETAIFAKIYQLQAAGERVAAPTRWRSVADRTLRDVRREPVMRTKADAQQRL